MSKDIAILAYVAEYSPWEWVKEEYSQWLTYVELHGTKQLIFCNQHFHKAAEAIRKEIDTLGLHVFEVRFVTLFSW